MLYAICYMEVMLTLEATYFFSPLNSLLKKICQINKLNCHYPLVKLLDSMKSSCEISRFKWKIAVNFTVGGDVGKSCLGYLAIMFLLKSRVDLNF